MASTNWADLAATAKKGNEPVPPNEYEVFVKTANAKKASTGKDMFAVKFEITDGEHKGKPIWNNFTVSPENPNALSYFFEHMAALGLDHDFFASNPSNEEIAKALVGAEALVTVKVEHRAGRERNNVDSIKPPAGGPSKREVSTSSSPEAGSSGGGSPAPF